MKHYKKKQDERVKFLYRNGFTKTVFCNVSDKHLEKLRQAVCEEQIRRREIQDNLIMRAKPAKRKKRKGFFARFRKNLTYFLRNVITEINFHADNVIIYPVVGSNAASAEVTDESIAY